MSDLDRVREHLDTADTVVIITRRRNGDEVPTFIWSVVAEGRAVLRSAFGPESWWYRRALADPAVAFDLGADPAKTEGTPDPVTEAVAARVEHLPDDAEHAAMHAAIDAALTEKYGHDPENLAPMLSAEARACTLLVLA
jgi:hypothetical protein